MFTSPFLLFLLLLLLSLCCGGIAVYGGVLGSLAYFGNTSDDDGAVNLAPFPFCAGNDPSSNSGLTYNEIDECWESTPLPVPANCCPLAANNSARIDDLYEQFNNLSIPDNGVCACNLTDVYNTLTVIENDVSSVEADVTNIYGILANLSEPACCPLDPQEVIDIVDANFNLTSGCGVCPAGPPGPAGEVNETAIIQQVLSLIDVNGTCLTCQPGAEGPPGPEGPQGEPGMVNYTMVEQIVFDVLANTTVEGNCDSCPSAGVNETFIIESVLSQIGNFTVGDLNATCSTCPPGPIGPAGEPGVVNYTVVDQLILDALSNVTFDGNCDTCPAAVVNETSIVNQVVNQLDVNGTCLTCPPGAEGPAGPPGPAGEVNETAIVEQVISLIDVNGTCVTCPAEPGSVNYTVVETIVYDVLSGVNITGDCGTCPTAEVNDTFIIESVLSQIDSNGTCLTCPAGPPGPAGPAGEPGVVNYTVVETFVFDAVDGLNFTGLCDTCSAAEVNETFIIESVLSQIDSNGTCLTCPAGPAGEPGVVNYTVVETLVLEAVDGLNFTGVCDTCSAAEVNETFIIESVLSQIDVNGTCLTCPAGPPGPIGPAGEPGVVNYTVVETLVFDVLEGTNITGDCSTCPVAEFNQTLVENVFFDLLNNATVTGDCSTCPAPTVNTTVIVNEVLEQIDVNGTCVTCPAGPPGPAGPEGPAGSVNETAIIEQILNIIDVNGTCVTCPASAGGVNDTNCCDEVAALEVIVSNHTTSIENNAGDIFNIYGILGNLTDESCCELAQNNSVAINTIEEDILLVEGDITNIYGILGNLTDESCCELAQNNSEAIEVVEGDVVTIYGILANLTDEVGENTVCCANNSNSIENIEGDLVVVNSNITNLAECCSNNSASIDVVEGDVTNIYGILANLTDEVGENTQCCEDNASCCANNTAAINNIYEQLVVLYQQSGAPYNGSQLYNGQVKINSGAGGAQPTFAVVGDVWYNFTYSVPLSYSPAPITQWPSNIGTPADSDIYHSGTNTFVENAYPGQVNIWRVILSFIKGPGQRKAFTVRLRNPVSGFTVSQATAIENTEYTGFRTFTFETISDFQSLPSPIGMGMGYILEMRSEVPIEEIKLESLTRITLARNL